MRAFTLVETLVYIGLLGIIMTGVMLGVYGLVESSTKSTDLFIAEDEGTFVIGKLDWALGSIGSVSAPASGYGTALTLTRTDGTQVDVRLNAGVIEMREGGAGHSYVPLTTGNVSVTSLGFYSFSGSPSGIEASTTIDGETFVTRRYTLK